ncbi:MAG: prepilin peptidase [Candidatus Coatesbacteria bacterium]|nr:MAG: prepilin peptidase [Candidatus Coatesbacteria bacterium]
MRLAVEIIGTALFFFLGAFIGNFYHLVLRKLPRGRYQLVLPPSCPSCGRPERRIWMLPVLWYTVLRGRCANCGAGLPVRILVLELISGAVCALIFYYYGFGLFLVQTMAFFFFFFVNYVIEFRYGVVLARLFVPAVVAGFVFSLLPGPPSPSSSVAGALLGGAIIIVLKLIGGELWSREGEARRQLCILAIVGAFLGWPSVLVVLGAAGAAAYVIPLVGKILKKRIKTDNVFYAAIFVTVTAVTFYRGDIIAWFLKVR